MKRKLIQSVSALVILFCSVQASSAQNNLKIGLIDMEKCMTDFYKSKQETARLQEMVNEKRKEINVRNADYQKLNTILAAEDKKANATEVPPDVRQAAAKRVQELLKERTVQLREVQEFQKKFQEQLNTMRTEIQKRLYAEVKLVIAEVSKNEGFDLVQDSAFLPRTTNKSILYFSNKVPDITEKVLAKLNANAPSKAAEVDAKKNNSKK